MLEIPPVARHSRQGEDGATAGEDGQPAEEAAERHGVDVLLVEDQRDHGREQEPARQEVEHLEEEHILVFFSFL